MASTVVWLAAVLGVGSIAGAVAFVLGRRGERRRADAAGRSGAQQAERHLTEARRAAEAERTQAILTAKEEIIRAREAWEKEVQSRREELERRPARSRSPNGGPNGEDNR